MMLIVIRCTCVLISYFSEMLQIKLVHMQCACHMFYNDTDGQGFNYSESNGFKFHLYTKVIKKRQDNVQDNDARNSCHSPSHISVKKKWLGFIGFSFLQLDGFIGVVYSKTAVQKVIKKLRKYITSVLYNTGTLFPAGGQLLGRPEQ